MFLKFLNFLSNSSTMVEIERIVTAFRIEAKQKKPQVKLKNKFGPPPYRPTQNLFIIGKLGLLVSSLMMFTDIN